jgi:DNA-binding beta-propeller fold protein YncE
VAPLHISTGPIAAQPPPLFLAKWGTSGIAEGQFSSPRGIAVDSEGNVYVVDSGNNRIQKFDSSGTFLRMWGWGVKTGAHTLEVCTSGCQAGISGSGDGQLQYPRGVALDSSSNVYVANTNADQIQKFSGNGAFLAKWGIDGTAFNGFRFPYGLEVDAHGNVYVGDSNNHRVKRHLPSGSFLTTWGWGVFDGSPWFQFCGVPAACMAGIEGTGDGQFGWPIDIAFDASGNIYVAELNNHRVQKFDKDFVFLTKWGSDGFGDDKFDSLTSIAVDAAGRLYAVDSNDARIKVFSGDGSPLFGWGTPGSGNGQFDYPFGIAIDRDGNIYISDKENHRIQKFGPAMQILIADLETRTGR